LSITVKFILFQFVILVPFILGFLKKDSFPQKTKIINRIVLTNLTVFEPPIIFWSIWGLKLDRQFIILPIAGFTIVVMGFIFGKLLLFKKKIQTSKRKTFLISSSLANHGFTLGGFFSYILLGEKGLALASIFIIYFMPYTFLFIFNYANGSKNFAEFKQNFLSKKNMPLYAIIAGLTINLLGIKRPSFYFPTNILLLISISLYYFTLGLNFYIDKISSEKIYNLFLILIKFLLIPGFTFLILINLNIQKEIKEIIFIESIMPAAIYSVITTILYKLEKELAANMFVINTLFFLFIVMPLFLFFKSLLFSFF